MDICWGCKEGVGQRIVTFFPLFFAFSKNVKQSLYPHLQKVKGGKEGFGGGEEREGGWKV